MTWALATLALFIATIVCAIREQWSHAIILAVATLMYRIRLATIDIQSTIEAINQCPK